MNDILKTVVSLSASGSLLMVLLLLGRPLYQSRVSKGWQYYIWLVVVARMLLPFAPEVNLMGTLFGQVQEEFFRVAAVPEAVEDSGTDTDFIQMDGQSETGVGKGISMEGEAGYHAWKSAGKPLALLISNLWLIWLGVAMLFLIRKVTIYQSFVKYIKAGRREVTDIGLLELLSQVGAELGVKRPVELYANSLISSPLLFGFFHPCIVLPETDLPETELRYIIRHELIHYRRGDMIYKWLVQAAICLHWFNPLVYRMEREISRACELACDEAVMRGLDAGGRRAYGDTLLHAMGMGGGYRNSLASLTLNEGAELLKERLGAIMSYQKISKKVRWCSAFLAAWFAAGAAAVGAYASPALSPAIAPVVKGDGDAAFRYTLEGYYEPPYLFEIGWNVNESAGNIYAGTELSLNDESSMEVFSTDESAGIWEDEEAVNALSTLLTRLKSESAETDFPLVRPLVVSVQNIGNDEPAALAGQYYQNGKIAGYAAVFSMLTQEEQSALLQKAYEDGEIAFFSASVSRLGKDSKLIGSFAQKAYADSNISFFSVLAGCMSPEALDDWTEKAAADKKRDFQAVLYSVAGEDEEKAAMEEELDERRYEEYRAHGITRQGKAFYYQGQMVKILLDIRQDSSFVTLEQNLEGAVDIRISRDKSGEIEKVRYLTQAEAEELFGAEEETDLEEPYHDRETDLQDWKDEINAGDLAEKVGVSRLQIQELPESVAKAIQDCAAGSWYVIYNGGQQYIYFKGFHWEYAYEPVWLAQGWQLRIERIRKKDGDLLIRLSDEAPVTVICDGEKMELETVGSEIR